MDEIKNPVAAYFLDGGFCLFVGCILTIIINNRFFSLERDTNPTTLEASHDSRPAQFALTTYATGAFVASIAYLMHNFVTRNVLANALLSVPSAFLGYLLGAFLSAKLSNLSLPIQNTNDSLCHRFFSGNKHNSAAQEPIDYYENLECIDALQAQPRSPHSKFSQ